MRKHPPETIFVAGPYTQPDPVENTNKAMAVGHQLIDIGLKPFIPHLCHFLHQQQPRDYTVWTEFDFVWLDRCDALLRLPGFSPGADAEVARARAAGIPVFNSVDEVKSYVEFETSAMKAQLAMFR